MLCFAKSSFRKFRKGLINEMRPSVTYDHPWSPEAWEDDLMKHLMGMLGIGSSAWWSLNPLRHVVDGDHDVFAVF